MDSYQDACDFISDNRRIQFSKRQLASCRQRMTTTLNEFMSSYMDASEEFLKDKLINIDKQLYEIKQKEKMLEEKEKELKRIEEIQNAREVEQNNREILQNNKEKKLGEILYGLSIMETELI